MPLIASFYGITIRMFFEESKHNPPHIHASYQNHKASYAISSGEKLSGTMTRRGERLIQDFIELNRDTLLRIWDTQSFEKIETLR